MKKILKDYLLDNKKEILILCIGTDRSTGDSLGPLVGTMLQEKNITFPVLGTLENPVHAQNLETTIARIKKEYSNHLIIAIDSMVGKSQNLGKYFIREKAVEPGKALGKNLPKVGDISICGVVNENETFNFIVLQNTRLFQTYTLAQQISNEILSL